MQDFQEGKGLSGNPSVISPGTLLEISNKVLLGISAGVPQGIPPWISSKDEIRENFCFTDVPKFLSTFL